MDEPEDVELTAPRVLHEDDDGVAVSLPAEAIEGSGLAPGEETMVAYREDGAVVLLPWAKEDVAELFQEEEGGPTRATGGETAGEE